MNEEEINYEIDNCITDLDTLKALDKRAMEDLENNTHKIEQQEVLTIIREFIRLKNDYKKEKEKNKELEKQNKILEIEKVRYNLQYLESYIPQTSDPAMVYHSMKKQIQTLREEKIKLQEELIKLLEEEM